MLFTSRTNGQRIGETSAAHGTSKSIELDSKFCSFRENVATHAGGTFFIVSPPDSQSNGDSALLPKEWWKEASLSPMIESSEISTDGYSQIVATNPTAVRASLWKIDTRGKDHATFEISAGKRVWLNVTVCDTFENIIRGYPHNDDPHHPPLTIQTESSHGERVGLKFINFETILNSESLCESGKE